jgi:hypothetical protein
MPRSLTDAPSSIGSAPRTRAAPLSVVHSDGLNGFLVQSSKALGLELPPPVLARADELIVTDACFGTKQISRLFEEKRAF